MKLRAVLCAGVAALACLALPSGAVAQGGEEFLEPASYADATTYSCRTPALNIGAGGNVNDYDFTGTCPNAQKISGPATSSPFGTSQQGYITRFKPSMLEVLPGGTVTPSVWDLHLHHVVWIKDWTSGIGNAKPTFASGEEKTEVMFPQGYGIKATGDESWIINFMVHNLTAEDDRQIYITWEIDWVPIESGSGQTMDEAKIRWMDVAGFPTAAYPVFDAERGYDQDGDGDWTFPDDVPTASDQPGYEEREKISPSANWQVPADGRTLLFGAGHLHPGGTRVDLEVSRDGPDAGSIDGDSDGETVKLFRSDAKYYEPAGAVSWDVSMEATRPEWRVSLKQGDTVSIDATYDVSKASWYEAMGILPLAVTEADDPLAKDPFDDAAAVQDMYDDGGILTHGRLPENIDTNAGADYGLADPRKLESKGKIKAGEQIEIDGFRYDQGGYSAFRGFPSTTMRPPLVKAGRGIPFLNLEAQMGMSNQDQVWHSITSCKAPCNEGSGIGYPLANGPIKFDSGQLGYGQGIFSQDVTTGSNEWTSPPLTKAGKTYTYFCRIHPFMRGSVRVKEEKKRK